MLTFAKSAPRSQHLDKACEKGGAPWRRRRRVAGQQGGYDSTSPALTHARYRGCLVVARGPVRRVPLQY